MAGLLSDNYDYGGLLGRLSQTWPARLAKDAYGAVTLPGDVYRGKVSMYGEDGHTNPEVINRSADLAGLVTLGASAVPAEANSLRAGIKAYHGSPHDFDRFDLSKIGTGEGAQAYGHGLYFSELPEVASQYRNLAPGPESLTPEVKTALRSLENLGFDSPRGALSAINGHPDWMARWDVNPARGAQEAKAVAAIEKFMEENPRGYGYEVQINADPNRFLDWDKPIYSQSEDVLRSLRNLGINTNTQLGGNNIYYGLDKGSPSQVLKDAGVPGIKYLDQGSRKAGDGSRNYVVFDDKIINILKKYGLAGASASPLAALMYGAGQGNNNQ